MKVAGLPRAADHPRTQSAGEQKPTHPTCQARRSPRRVGPRLSVRGRHRIRRWPCVLVAPLRHRGDHARRQLAV